ncbi:uncharacterized protein AC631_04645 [Debaryomyces fabryi]|uniref:Uncharacterized protein n=1 Tax=Debaryomyces fabryi TaxID=58627 RepID=A0A0V1PUC7_9ASCO|nr:uncharacterized protein AC631_04645 [Debaryomyces fabryi]KRZ99598.1 hypothetical protein AC631_04645 [Debaryomyces fabryi]CUM50542.1 unnamed protein product [Debaryomyces fabryi]
MSVKFNVHTSVNLGYNFPSIDESDLEFASHLPRDVLLNKNLKLEGLPKVKEPYYSRNPISKCFDAKESNDGVNDSPLYELLAKNQEYLKHYQLELTFSRSPNNVSKDSHNIKQDNDLGQKNRGIKRSRQTIEENASETNATQAQPSSIYKTPIPNKTIFFSSSASSKKKNTTNLLQSTPVSDMGEASGKKPNILLAKLKAFKMDKAEFLNLPIKSVTEKTTAIRHDNADEESMEMTSDYDHLACHAGNIMRMAVDSTMLGSSYNESFSPTFNNTFGGNDSILGLQSRKRYNDFFDDEADKSLIESMKSRWNSGLNRMKAKVIDINADELQQAVQAD